MEHLTNEELDIVGGGRRPADDTMYSTSVGVSGALFGLALTATAPVWGTALLLGGSIFASGVAIYYAFD